MHTAGRLQRETGHKDLRLITMELIKITRSACAEQAEKVASLGLNREEMIHI